MSWRNLFNIGLGKKFGLAQALIVVEAKPDITPDGAKTGAAFIEALGLPVVVVEEATAKIIVLGDSVKEMEEGIKLAAAGINTAQVEAGTAISNLKTEVKYAMKTVDENLNVRIEGMEAKRDAKIEKLQKKQGRVQAKANYRGYEVGCAATDKKNKMQAGLEKKIAKTETAMKESLADLREIVSGLTKELADNKKEIGTIEKIKTLFS